MLDSWIFWNGFMVDNYNHHWRSTIVDNLQVHKFVFDVHLPSSKLSPIKQVAYWTRDNVFVANQIIYSW